MRKSFKKLVRLVSILKVKWPSSGQQHASVHQSFETLLRPIFDICQISIWSLQMGLPRLWASGKKTINIKRWEKGRFLHSFWRLCPRVPHHTPSSPQSRLAAKRVHVHKFGRHAACSRAIRESFFVRPGADQVTEKWCLCHSWLRVWMIAKVVFGLLMVAYSVSYNYHGWCWEAPWSRTPQVSVVVVYRIPQDSQSFRHPMPIRRNLHVHFKLLPVYHFNCNCKTLSPRQMPKSLTVSQGPRFWTFCARQWVVAWWDRQVDKELLNTMFQINFSEQEMSWCILLSFASCEPAALTLPKVMCSSIAKVISRLLCRTAFGRLCWPWLTWERCSRIVSRPPKRADGSLGALGFHMFPLRIRCSTDSTAMNYICGSGVQDKLLLSGLRRLEMQTVVRMWTNHQWQNLFAKLRWHASEGKVL